MAQVCDGDCARGALGLLSEAEYIAEFGASCVGSQGRLYCVDGVPSVPPEKKMSRTQLTFNNAPSLSSAQIQSIGVSSARIDSAGTQNVTNNTCHDVQLWAQASVHQVNALGQDTLQAIFMTIEWRASMNGFLNVPLLHDTLVTTSALGASLFPFYTQYDSRSSGPWVSFGVLAAGATAPVSFSRSVSLGGPVVPSHASVGSNIQNLVFVDMIPV